MENRSITQFSLLIDHNEEMIAKENHNKQKSSEARLHCLLHPPPFLLNKILWAIITELHEYEYITIFFGLSKKYPVAYFFRWRCWRKLFRNFVSFWVHGTCSFCSCFMRMMIMIMKPQPTTSTLYTYITIVVHAAAKKIVKSDGRLD